MLSSVQRTELLLEGVGRRNRASQAFFAASAEPLARACELMADRFFDRGRLFAFGSQHAVTDAQHVAVEFVHPVIVGKRALPAVDVSHLYRTQLPALATSRDIVMGFAPPDGDHDIDGALAAARANGALTFGLPGTPADFSMRTASPDPFVHQEIVEVLYHTLWETVHLFFEQRERGHELGATAFLYPFLGSGRQDASTVADVAGSIAFKAHETERLRERVISDHADTLVQTAVMMTERLERGGHLLLFGNGGSATDANDWALDATASPKGYRPLRAISLSAEGAVLSALANDLGPDAMFLRQVVAHAGRSDVAIGISTNGSLNVALALKEAQNRGLLTIALLGREGGEVVRRRAADIAIVVGSDSVPRIQEVHASIYHLWLDLLAGMAA